MKFADVPFHNDVKIRLRGMADSGRMPHALLLEGVGGSGKFMLARALAQYIHCTDRTAEGDACGKCPNCIQHEQFNNIDTFYTFPVLKKSGKTALSQDYMPEFREFLGESPFMDTELWLGKLGNANGQPQIYVDEVAEMVSRMNVAPRQSKYKIVLIWLPERLREEAANKLLKLLEEPHSDTLFILASDSPSDILPTIYSRTQRIAVRRYSDSEAARILSDSGIDDNSALNAAALAEGNINEALKTLGTEKNTRQNLDIFIRLMRAAWTKKVAELREISNEIAGMGREGSARFYEYCARMIRENYIMNLGEPELNSLSTEESAFSLKFSPFINSANVLDIFRVMSEARDDTLMNGNGKIIAFDLGVKMILLIKRATDASK